MNSIRPPDELKFTGNVHENWKTFRQCFEFYLLAVGINEDDDRCKIALLLTVAGRSALDVYNTFVFTAAQKDKFPAVLEKFEDYCTPRKNETYERAAPLEGGKSPAELLMNRKLRTRLPSAEHLLEKKEKHPVNQNRLQAYNRTTKPLCQLVQDDVVRVRCDGQWGPVAKVIKETAPRSYEVLTEYGNTVRRNRSHLLKVPHTGRDGQEIVSLMD
ncbi:hypothetical protein SKAU_G00234690 [Synaphobranchus kaupii]|uniref:Uncharacterized protein n=1 Tax=Synaphobranchus kaupii TaxID=118154 RepID=A0A9Q1F6D6_SYNKA|nr:hypothetical protein SKAU_G00234690 [Synaphobranchus kaupii]